MNRRSTLNLRSRSHTRHHIVIGQNLTQLSRWSQSVNISILLIFLAIPSSSCTCFGSINSSAIILLNIGAVWVEYMTGDAFLHATCLRHSLKHVTPLLFSTVVWYIHLIVLIFELRPRTQLMLFDSQCIASLCTPLQRNSSSLTHRPRHALFIQICNSPVPTNSLELNSCGTWSVAALSVVYIFISIRINNTVFKIRNILRCHTVSIDIDLVTVPLCCNPMLYYLLNMMNLLFILIFWIWSLSNTTKLLLVIIWYNNRIRSIFIIPRFQIRSLYITRSRLLYSHIAPRGLLHLLPDIKFTPILNKLIIVS